MQTAFHCSTFLSPSSQALSLFSSLWMHQCVWQWLLQKKKILPDALARLVAVATAAVVCLPFWVTGRTGSWCKPGARFRPSPPCTALSTVWITRSLLSWASIGKILYVSNRRNINERSSCIIQVSYLLCRAHADVWLVFLILYIIRPLSRDSLNQYSNF